MNKPRLKTVYPLFVSADRTVFLGSPGTPRSARIEDPGGKFEALARLLDGTRTPDEICRDLGPDLSHGDVKEVISHLAELGYLEDSALGPPPAQFNESEIERYDRNFDYFSFFATPPQSRFDPQAALKAAHVTVLGVGGLGSHAALHLAALGVGHLHLVDFDTVEASNLNRQILFTEAHIGQPKATVAARALSGLNPTITITAEDHRIASPSDAVDCFDGCDLLLCAADRPRVLLDLWLNDAAVAGGATWLRGGSTGLTASLNLYVPGVTGCVRCQTAGPRDEGTEDAELMEAHLIALPDRATTPCISPVAGLLGAIAAYEAMRLITGVAVSPLVGRVLIIDLLNMETTFVDNPRRDACNACGALATRGVLSS